MFMKVFGSWGPGDQREATRWIRADQVVSLEDMGNGTTALCHYDGLMFTRVLVSQPVEVLLDQVKAVLREPCGPVARPRVNLVRLPNGTCVDPGTVTLVKALPVFREEVSKASKQILRRGYPDRVLVEHVGGEEILPAESWGAAEQLRDEVVASLRVLRGGPGA